MITQFWLLLIVSNAGFAVGTIFLKRFADTGSLAWLAAAFSLFAGANLAYARIIAQGLGQGAALSSIGHLLLMIAVGVVMGERLSDTQIIACLLSLIAIWLFALPPNSGV